MMSGTMSTEIATSKKFSLERIIRSVVLWIGYGVVWGLLLGLIVLCVLLTQPSSKGIWYFGRGAPIFAAHPIVILLGLAMLIARIVFFRLDDEFPRRNYLWLFVVIVVGAGVGFSISELLGVLLPTIAIFLAIPALHYWKRPEKKISSFCVTLDKLAETFAVWLGHGAVFGWFCGVVIVLIIFGVVKSEVATMSAQPWYGNVFLAIMMALFIGAPMGIIAMFLARVIFFRLPDEFLHANRCWLAVVTIVSAVAFGSLLGGEGTAVLCVVGTFLCAIALLWLIQRFSRSGR